MHYLLSIIGTVVLTYWLSRLLLRVPVAPSLSGLTRLIVVHAVSAILLGLWIGLVLPNFATFLPHKAAVVILPQLLWLIVDLVQGRHVHRI